MDNVTCEQFAEANLEEAFYAWDSGEVKDFCEYIMIAFMWMIEAADETKLFCPRCNRDTPSTQGGMFIHCKICNTSHLGEWLDEDDIIW